MSSIKSHFQTAATILKHFSRDPSIGRKSIVQVYNKKTHIPQDLPVEKIGIKKGVFSEDVEHLNRDFENDYNKFTDILTTRFPQEIMMERLRTGFMTLFNIILRNKPNYEGIIRIFNSNPELVREFSNPWYSVEVMWEILRDLMTKRAYPIHIRGYPDEVFISGDNPVIIHRIYLGTVYLIPISRWHIFCAGLYGYDYLYPFMEYYINYMPIDPEEINNIIRYQAETHYII